jgi:hypothetical protein
MPPPSGTRAGASYSGRRRSGRDYGVEAAGAALLVSDFASLLDDDEVSPLLDELSDEAAALDPFSLDEDSAFAPSVFESVDSDAGLFEGVLFL